MRIFALMMAALAAATLNWTQSAHAASGEERLPHISVTRMGKGDPVVLIPGLSTPRAVWDGVAPRLAEKHEVILVQVNGFAGDDAGANLKEGVLDGLVADLHAYLAKRGIKSAKVIGHSLGGLSGLKLAIAHPGDVERLMIVDSLPFFGALMDEKATVDAVRPMAAMMRARLASAYGKPSNKAIAEATARTMATKPASVAHVADWVMAADARVSSQAMYEAMTTDMRPALPKAAAAITLVYPDAGGQAGAKARGLYQRQYAGAPSVRFVGVPDAGHFVMLDQPERFAALVEEFVK